MSVILDFIGLGGVDPGLEVPFLPVILEGLIEVADRQSVVHDIAGILHGHCEELPQVLILWLLLQILLLPAVHILSIPDQHVEVAVQK
jgi:hypothetical protein